MSKTAKINIGLLGGRGYGKTVFLTKMIQLADCSEDGFIQFDAGSEALQVKNSLLENNGVLPATQIKEFSQYNFILGKQSGEKYRIRFCDYAGELLERIDAADSGTTQEKALDPSKNDADNSFIENFISNEGNKPYIKKVKQWLRKCDAFIVLMPEDVTNTKKYSPAEIKIYRQNIGVLLKVMQDDYILKNRPVCLAINKWDLAGEKKHFEDVIKTEPFASFRQQLKNMCGDNVFCMPISAFGKHSKDNPDKAAPDGKPINVSELLIRLAEKAEYSKVVSIKNTIESLSPLMSWLVLPYLLVYSWLEGATRARLVKLNSLLYKKYIKVVAYRTAIILAAIYIVIWMIGTANLYHEYKTWNRKITNGFNSPEMIEKLENELYAPHTFDCMFGNYSIFMNRNKVRENFETEKNKYNHNFLEKAIALFNEKIVIIHDPENDADLRKKEIQRTIDELEKIKEVLTNDAIEKIRIDEMIAILVKESDRTDDYKLFDDAYNKWLNIADEYEQANKAFDFLNTYTRDKYPERVKQIERVRETKELIEENKFQELYSFLYNSEENRGDFDGKTNDYQGRITRAKKRIEAIDAELNKFVHTSKRKNYEELKNNEIVRIDYLNEFGPFDLEVEQIRTLNINDDEKCAIKIRKFIDDKSDKYREKREKVFAELENKLHDINNELFQKMIDRLSHPILAGELDFEKKIQNAEIRIKDIERTITQLTDEALINQCSTFKNEELNHISELKHYGPFEKERYEILAQPDDRKPVLIDAFLKKYSESAYPLKKNEIKELNNIKDRITDSFYRDLNDRLHPIDLEANWHDSVKLANDNIQLISEYQKSFPVDSEQYKKCEKAKTIQTDLIRQMTHDGPFDDAYEQLMSQNKDNAYIRKIDDFLRANTKETYPNRSNKIKQLEQEMASRESALNKSLNEDLPADGPIWRENVSNRENKVKQIKENIGYFTSSSNYRVNLQTKIDRLNKEINTLNKYGPFDDEWKEIEKVIASSSLTESIPKLNYFLVTHSKEAYPDREKIIADAIILLQQLDNFIYKNAVDEINGNITSDESTIPWDTQIIKAQTNIKIYNDAINKLSSNSPYKRTLMDKRDKESRTIQKIEEYKKYYEAFDSVIAQNDFTRIPAINAFIKDYSRQYPNPLPNYRVEVLAEISSKLLDKFNSNLKEQLEKNADVPNADYTERAEKAQERIKALRFYESASDTHKDDEIQKEQLLHDYCLKNAEFSQDFAKIIASIDNISSKDAFIAIYNFYAKYPATKWMKERSKEYNEIKEREEKLSKSLSDRIETEWIIHQDYSTNEKTLSSYLEQEKVLKNALRYYPDFMAPYKRYMTMLNELNNRIQTVQRICDEEKRIALLLEESKKLSEDKMDSIGAFFVGIDNFERDYPDAINNQKLAGLAELLQQKVIWNEKLIDKMNEELDPYLKDLDKAPLEEKEEYYSIIISIFNRYFSYLSPTSDQFQAASRRRDTIVDGSIQIKEEIELNKALGQLKVVINDNSNSPFLRRDEITRFYSTYGTSTDNPRFRGDFEYIDRKKKEFDSDIAWSEVETKTNALVDNPPDHDEIIKVKETWRKCVEIEPSLRAYRNGVRRGADMLYNKLYDLHNELKAVSDEYDCYISVDDAAKKYQSSSTEDNFQNFMQAYNNYARNFPESSSRHGRDVKKLYDDISNLRANEIRKYQENKFVAAESDSFNKVIAAAEQYVRESTESNYNSYSNLYQSYYNGVSNSPNLSDQTNRNTVASHKETLTNVYNTVNGLRNAIQKMNNAFDSFKRNSSRVNLQTFLDCATVCIDKKINNPLTNYASQIMNLSRIQVELSSFNFNNSGFESPWGADVDFKATVSSGIQKVIFDIEDLKGDNKNSPSNSTLNTRLGVNIRQSMLIGYSDTISIEFMNYNFKNDIGNTSVPFAEILGAAINNGYCSHTFYAKSNRRSDKDSGSVTIRFSSLPQCNR